jgi:hypothetical protein
MQVFFATQDDLIGAEIKTLNDSYMRHISKLRFFITFFVQPCLKAGLKAGFQQCGE